MLFHCNIQQIEIPRDLILIVDMLVKDNVNMTIDNIFLLKLKESFGFLLII